MEQESFALLADLTHRLDELEAEFADRLTALERRAKDALHERMRAEAERDALAEQSEHEWRARQLADDAHDAMIGTLERRLAELEKAVGEHWAFFADQIIKLEERVTALEELHGTLERQPAEWVRVQGRHGQLPNDVYNVNVTERREEA